MGTLPTLQVLLDDGTGTFPKDITSKVLVAEGRSISFERGRQDWQGGVTAGSAGKTLDNSDGRFTPGSTVLGSPSPIKIDQKIRVKETINGVTLTRFTGYVKQWPVAWPATVPTFATAQIVATDAQARAERRVLKSLIDESVLASSPSAYWTCGEDTGAIAAGDTSGNQAASLTMTGSGNDVAFGDGAASFTAGKYLHVALAASPSPMGLLVTRTAAPAAAETVFFGYACELVIETSGKLSLYRAGGLAAQTSSSICDGKAHSVGVYGYVAAGQLTVDGATIGTFAPLGVALNFPQDLRFGGGGVVAPTNFTGRISNIALGAVPAAPTAESGTARMTRIAGYAGIPVGTLDTSLTTVPYADTAGKSAWQAIQDAADAEFGVAFIDGSGNLTFHSRNRVTAKTAPDLTLQASALTADPQVVTDDQQLQNYLDTTAAGTGATQTVKSATSESSHGRYPNAVEYLVQTDQEALDRANWIVGNFAEPSARYGTLTIDLWKMTAAQAQAVLSAVDIDAWLRIQSMPSQNTGGTTVDLVVEGYSEELTANSWRLTCNVVAKSLFTAWILGDATQGVLGSTTRLYV